METLTDKRWKSQFDTKNGLFVFLVFHREGGVWEDKESDGQAPVVPTLSQSLCYIAWIHPS